MWAHVFTAGIGIWLMSAPAVLGYGVPAETNDHVVGPLVASFAIIAWWQVTRGLRWINVVLGLWLIAAPWVLGYSEWRVTINSMLAGGLIALLSLVKGKVDKRFGGGWRELFRRRSSA